MQHLDLKKRFSVYCVKDGELLQKAQSLRAKVFFESSSPDSDKFDIFCDHLVAVDNQHQKVVGTYRLMRASVAFENIGFYSETEFDIANIKKNCRGELLEMGRACVLGPYRRFPVINLMWKAILKYVEKNSISFIFGCASIAYDAQSLVSVRRFFIDNCFSQDSYRVYPYRAIPDSPGIATVCSETAGIEKKLPSLVRGYLKMGAKVCGEPAWDERLKTADFFMLLDVKAMDVSYKEKFL